MTATLSGYAAAALIMVALDSLTTAAATPAAGERGSAQNPIPVPDRETLSKIGQNGYPTYAYYNLKTVKHCRQAEKRRHHDTPD